MSIQEHARRIQNETFERLTRESFGALALRSPTERVDLPADVHGVTVTIRTRRIDAGEVEVDVELRQRFWLLFHGTLRRTFRMRSDGSVFDNDLPTYDESNAGRSAEHPLIQGLPADIENQVVRYVRTEFGEHEGMHDALKVSDLVYLGAVTEKGSVTHYWRIPSAAVDRWAVVAIHGAELHFDVTTKRPAL